MAISKIREYFSAGNTSDTFVGDDLDTYACLGEAATPPVTNDAAVYVDKIGRLCKLWTDAQASGDEIGAGKIFDMLQKLINS